MSLVQRAKNILLDPKGTWPVIAAEPATVQSIYVPYVLALAAIPAICGFIGLSMLGLGALGAINMVVSYIVSLVVVYLMSLIVNALAPTFGGRKDPIAALKVVAYGATAGFAGGVFSLFPGAWPLGIVAGIYSIYLVYLGLPILMKSPEDKSVGYTAVTIVCSIVLGMVLGSLFRSMSPYGAPGTGNVSINAPMHVAAAVTPAR